MRAGFEVHGGEGLTEVGKQMDIGVGSFVVANALVSRQARNLPPS